jgi:hypothetical protein|tara:strand:- start:1800 stop:2432 length:633 start_codon:yes stop_codon:yes gene_type:complete
MNYTELKTNIQDICETSFTNDQLAMFTQQAEQKIYNGVQLPALRKVDEGPVVQTNKLYTLPSDYLYTYSLAIISSGTYTYLLNKDVNFLREAYPINTNAHYGAPKFYAYYSDTKLEFAPTPDANYEIEHVYGYYPASIVTANTTWLGTNFDSALLNGALVEAIRFMKGEPDIIANYEKMYALSMGLLKNMGDGKLREDVYRSGQYRVSPT